MTKRRFAYIIHFDSRKGEDAAAVSITESLNIVLASIHLVQVLLENAAISIHPQSDVMHKTHNYVSRVSVGLQQHRRENITINHVLEGRRDPVSSKVEVGQMDLVRPGTCLDNIDHTKSTRFTSFIKKLSFFGSFPTNHHQSGPLKRVYSKWS